MAGMTWYGCMLILIVKKRKRGDVVHDQAVTPVQVRTQAAALIAACLPLTPLFPKQIRP